MAPRNLRTDFQSERLTQKEDPSIYQSKDGHLKRTLRVRDFLALGVGTIVSTSIFTLQFMPRKDRFDVIQNIYNGLNHGGAFIFAEKTVCERNLYAIMGYSS